MKNLLVAALVVVASSLAFAGEGDGQGNPARDVPNATPGSVTNGHGSNGGGNAPAGGTKVQCQVVNVETGACVTFGAN